jgi:hypothetical protein
MKKLNCYIITALVLMVIVIGCSKLPMDNTDISKDYEIKLKEKDDKIAVLEGKIKDLEAIKSNAVPSSNNLISTAMDIMKLIKEKDMNALSQYVHPTAGVRFTPYFNVNTQIDKVFSASQVVGLMQDSQVLNWGNYDGSGAPIDLKFSDYYDKFVYDKDFVNPEIIGNNVAIGSGNIVDNVTAAYPNGQFIEFHFSQFDPQYEGADWESLRLVFEEYNDTWYLVGIIHGQWTI